MDQWTIDFSPGAFTCQAVWIFTKLGVKSEEPCGKVVPAGYVLARHPNYPEWMCMQCMIATVREELRRGRIGAIKTPSTESTDQ